MAEATFVSGDNLQTAKIVAGAAYAAGEVIAFGNEAAIVHPHAIANGAEGTIVLSGGVWDLVKDGTSGPAIAAGEYVAWIAGSNLASDVTTGNLPFGQCTVAASDSSASVRCLFDPTRVAANDES